MFAEAVCGAEIGQASLPESIHDNIYCMNIFKLSHARLRSPVCFLSGSLSETDVVFTESTANCSAREGEAGAAVEAVT